MSKNMSVDVGVTVTFQALNEDGTWDVKACYSQQSTDPQVNVVVVSADGTINVAALSANKPKGYKENTNISWNLLTTSLTINGETVPISFFTPPKDSLLIQPDDNSMARPNSGSATQVVLEDKGQPNRSYSYALALVATIGDTVKIFTLDPGIVNRRAD